MGDYIEGKTIFEGKALHSEWLGPKNFREFKYNTVKTRFKLTNLISGEVGDKISIKHNSVDGSSCGIDYSMGVETLVIAIQTRDDHLQTSSCTLNAVDEITLLNYFEKSEDVYIPSPFECTEEQISNPQDPKNCYYLSDEAAQARRNEMSDRRRKEWKARREAREANAELTNNR